MSILGENVNQVNQILPHKNKWAWDLYLKGSANNWVPTEISMQKDVEQWKSDILSENERLLIKRVLGFFACSESLVGNNLLLTVFRFCNDGEIRQYLSRQIFEESIHALTVVYCCDSLNLPIDEIYEAYINIPIVKDKDDFLIKQTGKLYDRDFNINSTEGKKEFIKNLFIYYVLFEGLLFYNSFAALLSLKRRNLMPGLGQQIEYTLRDEAMHVEFGVTLINKLREEGCEIVYDEALDLLSQALDLEYGYIAEMIPNGILGYDKTSGVNYARYLANRRFESLGFKKPFGKFENPFPWLSENIDLSKMKNFFESRVIDYQVGTIVDDM